MVLDMRQKLPFADASVDAIYSEHFMEHLPFDIVCNNLLKECFRILTPGGAIRMGVPNGELYIQRYQSKKAVDHSSKNVDSKTLMMDINDIGHSGGHFYLYDYEVLEKIFNEAGFKALHKCKSGETHTHFFDQMDQDDEWRVKNTVFIEGQK
jgi:predicted SAM-dependent methyltransferase